MFMNVLSPVFLACLLIMTSGCKTCQEYSLTYKLWTASDTHNYHEPSADADLKLYQVPERMDVLVSYNEVNDKSDSTQRRAYFLYVNIERIKKNHKPRFVNPQKFNDAVPIPVEQTVSEPSSTNTHASVYATTEATLKSFTLHTASGDQGPYDLPVYRFKSDVAWNTVLTPFAVVGDALIFGGMTAILFLPAWGPSLSGRSL